jgi:hypothetical protein
MKTVELPKSSDGRLSILVRLKNLVLSQLGRQAVTQLDGFLDTALIAAERIGGFYSAQTNSVSAVSPTQRWV